MNCISIYNFLKNNINVGILSYKKSVILIKWDFKPIFLNFNPG